MLTNDVLLNDEPFVNESWFLLYWHLKLFIAHRLQLFLLKGGNIFTSLTPQKRKGFHLQLTKRKKLKRIKVVIRRLKANKKKIEQYTPNC